MQSLRHQTRLLLVKIRLLKSLLIMSYWCSQCRYGAILPVSFVPESPILLDNLTILYCLLNDWNHRQHSRLIEYSVSYEKYANNASRPKCVGMNKLSLVS